MPGQLILAACVGCIGIFSVSAVEIAQVTLAKPEGQDRTSRDAWLSGNGQFIVFRSESDFLETGLAADADGVYNVWRHDVTADGMASYSKISDPQKPSDKDSEDGVLSHDGTMACFTSDELGTDNIYYASYDGTWHRQAITTGSDSANISRLCSISGDGSSIVFQSKAKLVPGMMDVANYQIYLTRNNGHNFTLVTPWNITPDSSSDSDYPMVSLDGNFVVFRSRMTWPPEAVVSSREEAWLYRAEDGALAKITNLAGHECSSDEMFAIYQSLHDAETLENNSITSGTTSSCDWAALNGHRMGGVGTIGVGAHTPEISADGRFVVYTTNFDVADVHGTHETPSPVVHHNLFLYDRVLGFTWQITQTGANGAGFKEGGDPMTLEEWCCPDASSSTALGTCTEKNELRGLCCWQGACGFPALNPHISGDGHHLVFVSDMDYLGTGDAHRNDLEIWHYYVPTGALMRITTTSNSDIDDLFPRTNHDGTRIVWHGDADFSNPNNDMHDAYQIALATLTHGCSKSSNALNYHASPDVEVCCQYPQVETAHQVHQKNKVEVTMTFVGNATERWGRLPWPSDAAKNAFCEHFVIHVHQDLACALAVPMELVKVVSPATAYAGTKSRWSSNSCGDWEAEGGRMTVKVDFWPISPEEPLQVPSPEQLVLDLLAQHGDPSSQLWKGYITKTLSADDPTWRVLEPEEVPDVPAECTSRGSCYDSQTHIVSCNVPETGCSGDKLYWYEPSHVGGSGCCHCQASCDFSRQTAIYETCSFYDEGDMDNCGTTSSTTITTMTQSQQPTTLRTTSLQEEANSAFAQRPSRLRLLVATAAIFTLAALHPEFH